MPSKRGRHRDGMYVAILYSLELEYARLAAAGQPVQAWRPLPRNRPDQFVTWVASALSTLGYALPESFGALRGLLRDVGLGRIEETLSWMVARKLGATERAAFDGRPWRHLLRELGVGVEAGGAAEAHPQARKMTLALRSGLDDAWRAALEAEASRNQVSPAAVLVGGVPPGYVRVFECITSTYDRNDIVEFARDNSAFLAYAVVTGGIPPLPAPWSAAVAILAHLERPSLTRMRSLGASSRRAVLGLDEAAWRLLERMREWRMERPVRLAAALERLTNDEVTAVARALRRGAARRSHVREMVAEESAAAGFVRAGWPASAAEFLEARALVEAGAWRQLASLDGETWSLAFRGELPDGFVRAYREATPDVQERVMQLLEEYWESTDVYMEDVRIARELIAARSPLLLGLRELFPRSVGWLDAWYARNDVAILAELEETVGPEASAFSRRIEDRLLRSAAD